MGYTEAILPTVLLAEFFALIHHGSLWVRNRASTKRDGIPLATTQLDLLQVQAVCWAALATAVAVRMIRRLDPAIVTWWGWMLFAMAFAAFVYWRYPEAAPIAITATDWTEGPNAGLMRFMRNFYACLATAGTFVMFMLVSADL